MVDLRDSGLVSSADWEALEAAWDRVRDRALRLRQLADELDAAADAWGRVISERATRPA